ncbi:hypothetical protein BGZ93_004390 [Podila epicladia]|nr:hypothetical protein BGZ92_003423 [Podila epicladia]KAG0096515.1 hypothetical protein BGZ93_004390 [Podila epicladia]
MSSEPNRMRQEEVMPLIIGQLAEYGYSQLALVVAEQTHSSTSIKPSARLSELLFIAKEESTEIEPTDQARIQAANSGIRNNSNSNNDDLGAMDEDDDPEPGAPLLTRLNLDTDPKSTSQRSGPNFSTVYTTTHKDMATSTAFSKDGRYAASGSADTSLKILDVNKMKLMNDDVHPVVRTLYDHDTPVTDVDFHPNGLVLAASSDTIVKLYDLSKPSVKRSFRYLQDTHPISSVSFHPSGDFLLVGSEAETVRIFDVKTLQCFTPKGFSAPAHNSNASAVDVAQQGPHKAGINSIQYASTGSVFITASQDGSIKVWDAVSGKVIRTIDNAHSGKGVTSATISKNGRYILSGGFDSVGKLWDIGSGKLIHGFTGAVQKTTKQSMIFSYNESFVFSSDESNNTIVCWDARNGTLLKRYAGHQGLIRSVSASPTENGLISCGNDNRVRYWTTPSATAAASAAANANVNAGGRASGPGHSGHVSSWHD